jgi:multidrug resistance efflux pump
MRGKWILFAGVTILLAIAAGALSVWHQSVAPKATETPKVAPSPIVNASEVSLPGKVQAQRVVSVPAPIDGTIEAFSADVGQDVFEGQLIAQIRNTKVDSTLELATAELGKAQARVTSTEGEITAERLEASRATADATRSKSDLDRAEKTYLRQQMLLREGATPRLVFEKSEREYNTARAESESKEAVARAAQDRLDELNRNLDVFQRMLNDKTQNLEQAKADTAAGEVHSPVDGVVIARRGESGEVVDRSVRDLFQIAVMMSAMEVVVDPQPPVLNRIHPGQSASIIIAEAPNGEIAGTVREIRNGQVVIEFISPTAAIKPGLSAQVRIKLT